MRKTAVKDSYTELKVMTLGVKKLRELPRNLTSNVEVYQLISRDAKTSKEPDLNVVDKVSIL